jgi:hypothetical protein
LNDSYKDFARRLSRITVSTGEESTPVNFAFGALYSLLQADKLNYPKDPSLATSRGRGLTIWEEVKLSADHLASTGNFQTSDAWLAGYHFNNALMRLAASFEHIVRYRTGLHDRSDTYAFVRGAASDLGFKDAWMVSWDSAHEEVNRIRHRNHEFPDGPQMPFTKACEALDHLIEALQWGLRRDSAEGNAEPLAKFEKPK